MPHTVAFRHQLPGAADVVEVGGLDRDVLHALHAEHAHMGNAGVRGLQR
ncbi:hypothetical protein [Streptomyces sp. NPDC048641]